MTPKRSRGSGKVGRPRKTKQTKTAGRRGVSAVRDAAKTASDKAVETVGSLKATAAKRPEKAAKTAGANCRVLNFAAAFLYLAQAVLLFFLIEGGMLKSLDVSFLSENELTGQLQNSLRGIYEMDIKHVLLIILAAGGLMHLFFGFKAKAYGAAVKQKLNVWRWLGGSLIFGLVAAVTASLLGIADMAYLLLIFTALLAFGWLGLAAEYLHLHIDSGKSRLARLEQKNVAFKQVFGLIFSLKRVSAVFPWLMIGLSLVAGNWLASSTAGWEHVLIYAVGLLPVLVWLINASLSYGIGRKAKEGAYSYSAADTVYLASLLICTSAWVWLVALLGV